MSVLEDIWITKEREHNEKETTWHRNKKVAHRTSHHRCLHKVTTTTKRWGSQLTERNGTNWLESGWWTWIICTQCQQEKRSDTFEMKVG